MSIKEKYTVKSIAKHLCKEWLLNKHYAKRIPSISYAFGLFNEDLMGVMTIGKPASNSLCVGVCGKHNSKYVYELNRLCVNDNLEKNVLSYFVSQSLKMLNDLILVSYADTKMQHNGYIYQATNWIYTGKTKERTDIGSEDNSHSRHYNKNIDYSKNRKFRSSKHRYIYFTGNKRKWLKELNYNIQPYPKGQNKRYDSSYKPTIQKELF
tara:strand:- start:22 stop:648 length:627 start_codon:yes stop_codon:yes gene_type:complete